MVDYRRQLRPPQGPDQRRTSQLAPALSPSRPWVCIGSTLDVVGGAVPGRLGSAGAPVRRRERRRTNPPRQPRRLKVTGSPVGDRRLPMRAPRPSLRPGRGAIAAPGASASGVPPTCAGPSPRTLPCSCYVLCLTTPYAPASGPAGCGRGWGAPARIVVLTWAESNPGDTECGRATPSRL